MLNRPDRRKRPGQIRLPPLNKPKSTAHSPSSALAGLTKRLGGFSSLSGENISETAIKIHRSTSPTKRSQLIKRSHYKLKSSDRLEENKATLLVSDLTLGKCIGRGKLGRVVRSVLGDREVAVKIVEASALHYAEAEKEALSSLIHTNIVRFYDYTADATQAYIVLELVQGEDLFHTIRRKRMSRPDLNRVAAQVLIVLEFIHDSGFVYRDLKPENIMVLQSGDIKLIDFGFAKRMVADRTYTTLGSPEYMAPEVILGEGHDKAADWWSYGILLYELLCGQPPFQGESVQDTYDEIVCGVFEFSRNIEPSAKDIIRRLLVRDPQLRLGNLMNGTADLKRHKFFTGTDWDRVGDSITAEVLEFN